MTETERYWTSDLLLWTHHTIPFKLSFRTLYLYYLFLWRLLIEFFVFWVRIWYKFSIHYYYYDDGTCRITMKNYVHVWFSSRTFIHSSVNVDTSILAIPSSVPKCIYNFYEMNRNADLFNQEKFYFRTVTCIFLIKLSVDLKSKLSNKFTLFFLSIFFLEWLYVFRKCYMAMNIADMSNIISAFRLKMTKVERKNKLEE